MAVFGIGKKDNDKEKKDTPVKDQEAASSAPKAAEAGATPFKDVANVLMRPRITEKATIQTSDNVYTFEVTPDANKKQVGAAVERLYNVTPVKIRMISLPSKTVRSRTRRGKVGTKSGVKKALVFLKEGDTIQFV